MGTHKLAICYYCIRDICKIVIKKKQTNLSCDDHTVQLIKPWRPKLRRNIITARPQGWVSARKHQCMTAITTMWTESSWAFCESYTANESWIVRSSDGGPQGDKGAHNSTTKVSFCTIIMFVSLHDSDHEGVVRIFVALSCELRGYLHYLFTLHSTIFPYQECNYTLQDIQLFCIGLLHSCSTRISKGLLVFKITWN